ncbi:MAG: type II secretion system protein [Sulfurovum sp.]
MYYYKLREGIAMLELVFSIVIMGIVMMSAPMLVSQANKGTLIGTQQEAIAAGATDIGLILTRHWDANDTNESLESPILATNSGQILLGEDNRTGNPTGLRVGMPPLSTRSFLTARGTRLNASIIGQDGNMSDFNDIDDYNGDTHFLQNSGSTTTATGDYLDRGLTFTTTVSYVSDAPTGGTAYSGTTLNFDFNSNAIATTSNIKLITIRVQSNSVAVELQKDIILRAFSCNIGTYSLAKRIM